MSFLTDLIKEKAGEVLAGNVSIPEEPSSFYHPSGVYAVMHLRILHRRHCLLAKLEL